MRRRPIKIENAAAVLLAGALTALAASPAAADRIKHPTAVFAGLDKITGRIISFDVAIDETVQFGTLQITPRACYTRPATEAPLTDGFVEAEEMITPTETKKLFAGWMFAASPGLHGIEHPVYDAWLTDCKGGKEVIPDPTPARLDDPGATIAPPPPKPGTQPRPRRRETAPPTREVRPSLPPGQETLSEPQVLAPPRPSRSGPPGLVPPGDIPFDNRR
ncbi:DUF2155 domain-containing protein [Methylocella sp. CPCC 101449]|jgi:hypothetical protein|uniref:DUF2155 domain-containing protein n=1 Tax=Methylocella sp. CPCC 101449 TaxID=2987531 RepID=UPI00288FEAD6|nr:DUF2155 domain-containing protein [Methylocella sp. CPCC 101449]MDT2022350.1 DUF2155 domain-containing protein [Methylocella sp. CPCC 101449]HEV2572922.1 DUF2155 domain-containing protein [Beijerinckiaceae bacterium]